MSDIRRFGTDIRRWADLTGIGGVLLERTGEKGCAGTFIRRNSAILEELAPVLEDLKWILEDHEHLLEEAQDILEDRKFIRRNKNILEHFRIY
ncbi:hypothetical protein MKX73_12435 [Solibacillus sp. FSL W7-1436]|uniref:hypothetical protein n=1 Tax=Solibacillus sp. FSL W7-1436 TaxID=2921705 RepID=UPI0030FB2CE0